MNVFDSCTLAQLGVSIYNTCNDSVRRHLKSCIRVTDKSPDLDAEREPHGQLETPYAAIRQL